jgi:archaellum component FlaD/FlaE
MVDLKKVLGKKKEDEGEQEDTILFDVSPEKLQEAAAPQRGGGGVQSFSVPSEGSSESQQKEKSKAPIQEARASEVDSAQTMEQPVVNEQLQDLSSNLKNLVYDFRSFMSEAGSPFNPNDIPASKPESTGSGDQTTSSGYISAKAAGAGEKDAVENPSDVERGFESKFVSPIDKMKIDKLLEPPKKSSPALKQFNDVLNANQATKFAKDLRSNLDATDMPALIRAVNSTDYLLHAVGRKNLLKILEVGTREGWIRPEVERLVLSVAEVLSTAGVEADDRIINVNDLLRVVYYLNRLLDPEISEFLTMNSTPRTKVP